ncbi:putative sulfate exporter family transporter, partial [Singulisphaera rosea]
MRSWFASEDWFAVWLAFALVLIALPTAMGIDLLGWVAAPQVWLGPAEAVRPVSKAYVSLPGLVSLAATFVLILGLVGICAAVRAIDLRSFVPAFTFIYWVSVLSWIAGHYGYIALTPDKRAGKGLSWSLGLTGEAGYLVALMAGLFVANVTPALAARLKSAARPEWFIKTAIVLLGAGLG